MEVNFPRINNKLAFFDFDRTLVAHKYSQEALRERESYYFECLRALTVLEDDHAHDRPLPCMQWYTKKLSDEGYGLIVLTHEVFNLRDQLKKDQLARFYPEVKMTYMTVDSPEHKIDMMMAIAPSENCPLSDIIFVDDMLSTVNAAIREGINGKHLSDIVVMYESEAAYHEQNMLIKKQQFTAAGRPSGTQTETQPDIPDEEMDNMLRECRILAEMNNREQGGDLALGGYSGMHRK